MGKIPVQEITQSMSDPPVLKRAAQASTGGGLSAQKVLSAAQALQTSAKTPDRARSWGRKGHPGPDQTEGQRRGAATRRQSSPTPAPEGGELGRPGSRRLGEQAERTAWAAEGSGPWLQLRVCPQGLVHGFLADSNVQPLPLSSLDKSTGFQPW